MKSPDEIKKGLECGSKNAVTRNCNACPYAVERIMWNCQFSCMRDALALIRQKEQENAGQAETIMWMEAERDDFKRTIQQLEAQVPRWIPVEEKMPEPHEYVAIIVLLDGYTYLRVGWYGNACQWMQSGLGMIEGEVTHWMPLPEAPKEEHEE